MVGTRLNSFNLKHNLIKDKASSRWPIKGCHLFLHLSRCSSKGLPREVNRKVSVSNQFNIHHLNFKLWICLHLWMVFLWLTWESLWFNLRPIFSSPLRYHHHSMIYSQVIMQMAKVNQTFLLDSILIYQMKRHCKYSSIDKSIIWRKMSVSISREGNMISRKTSR